MPLTHEEWIYVHAEITQAQALSQMALERVLAEGDVPQPGDALPVLVRATSRALDDVEAVVEGHVEAPESLK